MNKFWRRTASHKNNNHGGKHKPRLQAGGGNWFLFIMLAILLVIAFVWKIPLMISGIFHLVKIKPSFNTSSKFKSPVARFRPLKIEIRITHYRKLLYIYPVG